MLRTPETAPKKDNWMEYINAIGELAEKGDWNQLESLLAEDHPVLPGEREAFLELKENLGRTPLVELDQSGFHIVPKNLSE